MSTGNVLYGIGIYVTLGVFALMFMLLDTYTLNTVSAEVSHDQAARIAISGINFAIGEINTGASPMISSVNLFGGTASYTVDRPAGLTIYQWRVSCIGTYQGHSVTMVAILGYKNKWSIQRIYRVSDSTETMKFTYD